MKIRPELIEELLDGQDPATLLGALKQALMNRLLAAEFDHHLEQGRTRQPAGAAPNHRNGSRRKRVLAGDG